MSLFNLFKKKPVDSIPQIAPSAIRAIEEQSTMDFSIHDDLDGLIWIGQGARKNYFPDPAKKPFYEINGIRIQISFMNTEEPSLIFPMQPVSIPQDETNVPRPPYFPSYSILSPEQKWIYLKLLANPYDSSINIGYVFILYYGLERHLISGDFEGAFRVILKLRDVHENKSFQAYSAKALILSSLKEQRADLAKEFIDSINKEHELYFSDNLFLLCYLNFDIPLTANDVMRMSKSFEFENQNYIKKYPGLFSECLTTKIRDLTSTDEIRIKDIITKKEFEKITWVDTSIFANTSIGSESTKIPFISDSFKLKKQMFDLLEKSHEMVKVKLAEMRKDGNKIQPQMAAKKEKTIPIFNFEVEKHLCEELAENSNDMLSRHFRLMNLHEFYYGYRSLDQKYLDKCIEYCWLDIKSLAQMNSAYVDKYSKIFQNALSIIDVPTIKKELEEIQQNGFQGRVVSFERLAIIYEKEHQFQKAIEICDLALAFYRNEDYGFLNRKEKLEKKLQLEKK